MNACPEGNFGRNHIYREIKEEPTLRTGGFMESDKTSLRKNPSRETCENIIRRILMTEILEKGKNEHFRSAADFMSYFESLYPASSALTKQVQRAVKSLNMPKDDFGYFIPNKTTEQLAHERELISLFEKAEASVVSLEGYETLFLKADRELCSYLVHVLENSSLFEGKYLTIQQTSNGLIFYTKNRSQLEILLNSLIVR